MAERDGPPNRRPADVPSIAEKGQPLAGREAEFAHLNKHLRACFVCKLIKATAQFMDSGCDNCRWMDMSDMESLEQCTTTNFSGLMTLMEPPTSWVAKWTHTSKCVPGCYALSINEEMPRRLQESLENRGVRMRR
ncbi:hypothetical protein OEZ86_002841 [Tetradesmus obliquus]|uniref:Uncharacterized protein n=2 Tax=Tetradesmus obliquus TaxID=3088 RepID=A0A383WJD9_TETOB|nr:hypothetical protein OEZ85_011939 [Tetradesmus obliquus]WIA31987.1 hypothetical protein OEZ86_002841 [Tetradesmus obliquus]|eukprot:jgi/Sobl393_1/992/SZX77580.1